MFATFVNSSDGFADCWLPFFTLLERYGGPLRKHPVYLNTERAGFSWPGLDLRPTRVWSVDEEARPAWSECLRRGIEAVAEPYVLYLQEDYFLLGEVREALLQRAIEKLDNDRDAGVVYLNKYGPMFTQTEPVDDALLRIQPPARYLACTQAGLWRKEALLSLIRTWESGWGFEIFGSRRAKHAPFKFLTIRPELMNAEPVIDYIYTGVIKGQWKQECVALFEEEGIEVDFAKRGMYQERGRLKSRIEVARKLSADRGALLRSLSSLR